jgi:predicted nucleic acid-binding protein
VLSITGNQLKEVDFQLSLVPLTVANFRMADDTPGTAGRQARRLFDRAGEGTLRLLVPSLVIAQVVWTLESFYRASREYVTGLLQALLETLGVTALEPRVVSRCIEIYGAHNIEIVDAYLVALAAETQTPVLATFNKKDFRRFPHLKLIS